MDVEYQYTEQDLFGDSSKVTDAVVPLNQNGNGGLKSIAELKKTHAKRIAFFQTPVPLLPPIMSLEDQDQAIFALSRNRSSFSVYPYSTTRTWKSFQRYSRLNAVKFAHQWHTKMVIVCNFIESIFASMNPARHRALWRFLKLNIAHQSPLMDAFRTHTLLGQPMPLMDSNVHFWQRQLIKLWMDTHQNLELYHLLWLQSCFIGYIKNGP